MTKKGGLCSFWDEGFVFSTVMIFGQSTIFRACFLFGLSFSGFNEMRFGQSYKVNVVLALGKLLFLSMCGGPDQSKTGSS
ncbi:hypothetical protein RJ641_036699 [Dillenia turbinata]|uniref:Uncharacterized protein n=1 Tax=Dillenia turbinata TaxID=194707 RepID=A0AAN8VGH5_9MAGN